MRCKLLKHVAYAVGAAMPVRQLITYNRPLLRMCSTPTPLFYTPVKSIAHAHCYPQDLKLVVQQRPLHATCLAERKHKSKKGKGRKKGKLTRHHGKHNCGKNYKPKSNPCCFKGCLCIGKTYRSRSRSDCVVNRRKDWRCPCKKKKCSIKDDPRYRRE